MLTALWVQQAKVFYSVAKMYVQIKLKRSAFKPTKHILRLHFPPTDAAILFLHKKSILFFRS
jgi:hypothetical protein